MPYKRTDAEGLYLRRRIANLEAMCRTLARSAVCLDTPVDGRRALLPEDRAALIEFSRFQQRKKPHA
jgi:hypothetical protein